MGGTRRFDGITHGGRLTPLTLWLAVVAAVFSVTAADGRLASAAIGRAAPVILADVASPPADDQSGAFAAPAERPDFHAVVADLSDGQAGRPFSYTVQVRNDGGAAGSVKMSTTLPPEFSNVRVNAPGFACTRQFTPSGPQAGTVVACSRNSLDHGATADITIDAYAPSAAGEYRLLATADPRDGVTDADGATSQVVVKVHVTA